MKTTIIYAHPWNESFNKAILDEITKTLAAKGREHCVIDLNKDGFNPVITEKELSLFKTGEHCDPLVGEYQNHIKNSDELVFIFPIWWNDMPAILKGFLDKVMLRDFAYTQTPEMKGLLTYIQSAKVITTSDVPTECLVNDMNDPIKKTFINSTLGMLGIHDGIWLNHDAPSSQSDEKNKDFLAQVAKLMHS